MSWSYPDWSLLSTVIGNYEIPGFVFLARPTSPPSILIFVFDNRFVRQFWDTLLLSFASSCVHEVRLRPSCTRRIYNYYRTKILLQ